MPTPAEILDKLAEGKSQISERTFTNWRYTGLLPDLDQKGKGQGKGKQYIYRDDSYNEQMILIRTLIDEGGTLEGVLLALFFTGHEVKLDRVRTVLLTSLKDVQRPLRHEIRAQGLEDGANAFAAPEAKKLHYLYDLQKEKMLDSATEIMKIISGKGTQGDFALELLGDGVENVLQRFNFPARFQERMDTVNLEAIFPGLQKVFALPLVQQAVASASDRQLQAARDLWIRIMDTIYPLTAQLWQPSDEIFPLKQRLIAKFGIYAIPMIILFRKKNRIKVEETVAVIEKIVPLANIPKIIEWLYKPTLENKKYAMIIPDFTDKIVKIWGSSISFLFQEPELT